MAKVKKNNRTQAKEGGLDVQGRIGTKNNRKFISFGHNFLSILNTHEYKRPAKKRKTDAVFIERS